MPRGRPAGSLSRLVVPARAQTSPARHRAATRRDRATLYEEGAAERASPGAPAAGEQNRKSDPHRQHKGGSDTDGQAVLTGFSCASSSR